MSPRTSAGLDLLHAALGQAQDIVLRYNLQQYVGDSLDELIDQIDGEYDSD